MRICMSNGDLIPHSVMYVLDMVPLILLCFIPDSFLIPDLQSTFSPCCKLQLFPRDPDTRRLFWHVLPCRQLGPKQFGDE
jgi:hypothetical protein